MTSPSRVRLALVGILTLLVLCFAFPRAYTQIPRPPGMPGGIGGRTPGMPGVPGMSGVPGTPGGLPGRPPGIGTGGTPGPGRFGSSFVWKCSQCGFVTGTGPVKPNLANCPQCGARFMNTPAGAFAGSPTLPIAGGGAGSPAPFVGAGGGSSSPSGTGSVPGLSELAEMLMPTEPEGSGSSTAEDIIPPSDDFAPHSDPNSGLKKALIIVALVVGVIFVLGALALIAVVAKNTSHKHSRSKKRRRRGAYDDIE